jgi:hypothetical protein
MGERITATIFGLVRRKPLAVIEQREANGL